MTMMKRSSMRSVLLMAAVACTGTAVGAARVAVEPRAAAAVREDPAAAPALATTTAGQLPVLAAAARPARSHAEVAFDFFRHKGLSKSQAAGIVGNLQQESSVDPTADQAGGPGRGIAQWGVGGRWDSSPRDNLM
jgi:hypothetical protein